MTEGPRQTDRHSHQALQSTGLENSLPEARGRRLPSVWAGLVLSHPASLDVRSQLQSSTQLRLGVPEPHGAVGRSEGGGERATKGRDEGQNPGGGKEEQCREGVRCEIACGRSGRLAAQLTCAVSCWTVIYSLILSIRSALNRG